MTAWMLATFFLLGLLAACGIGLVVARQLATLLVLAQAMTSLGVLVLFGLAVGLRRPAFLDLALTLALLSGPAALLAAHYVERVDS